MRLSDVAAVLGIIVAIISISTFLAGLWSPPDQKPPTTPTPILASTSTPSLTATPTSIIDTMDSTSGWRRDKYEGSINIKSVPGRTGNATEISFDLKEWGEVSISKIINPEILSNKEGIRFLYLFSSFL
jgi:hypothetical protein